MVSVYERRYEIMAKINKYWGFVAVGAVAAAAAGAIAALAFRKDPLDDFEDFD